MSELKDLLTDHELSRIYAKKTSNLTSERFNSFHNFMTLPSIILFFSTTMLGTIIAISRSSWLYVWIGLELNLLSFIPLIALSTSLQETEAAVKYFINQAIGSGLLLTAALMLFINKSPFVINWIIVFIFISSLMLKIGRAPFHWWFPPVMSSLPWITCIILASWQKIAPLTILFSSQYFIFPLTFIIIASINALIGGIGGLNQTHLRAIIAYSSIGHIGWIIASIPLSIKITVFYFFIYTIITVSIIRIIAIYKHLTSSFSRALFNSRPSFFICLTLILISLGGLPPLLGFIPKWIIFSYLSLYSWNVPLLILIAGSLINLFYYLRIAFNFFLSTPSRPSNNISFSTSITILTLSSCFSSLLFVL